MSPPRVAGAYFLLRVSIGVLFLAHGLRLFFKYREGDMLDWMHFGGEIMGPLGVESFHTFFGFMGVAVLIGGGACLILGFMFHPAVFLLVAAMGIATAHYVALDKGFQIWSYPASMIALLLFFACVGRGPATVDGLLFRPRAWRRATGAPQPSEAEEDRRATVPTAEGK